jgi:TPR repeat protein
MAQHEYATNFHTGIGVTQDFVKATYYYKLAANQDDSTSHVNYGLALENGGKVTKNLEEAALYYKMAICNEDQKAKA